MTVTAVECVNIFQFTPPALIETTWDLVSNPSSFIYLCLCGYFFFLLPQLQFDKRLSSEDTLD